MPREVLYERINLRVDKMLKMGLVDEVKELWEKGANKNSTAMQAIGYKELIEFLEDKCDISQAIEDIKRESRRYAKRQMTWFNRNEKINWVTLNDSLDFEKVYEKCFTFLKEE